MEAIYEECRRLKAEFIKNEQRNYPDSYFRTDDGERYFKADHWDRLQLDALKYYYECLDERSIRVPKE